MFKKSVTIQSIPAIVWGEESKKLFIAVHGNLSNKSDEIIALFAEEATRAGYQVLSFDLPEHGDRKEESTRCKVDVCIKDLAAIMDYARLRWDCIRLFACSIGAYFSLQAYKEESLEQCLFLSPIVDMEQIILNMMTWFDVSESRLKAESEVSTPIGHTLYWDYYCYVKEHPIDMWDKTTAILYGSADDICDFATLTAFRKKFDCDLTIMEEGTHHFHTKEQLAFFVEWVKTQLMEKQLC